MNYFGVERDNFRRGRDMDRKNSFSEHCGKLVYILTEDKLSVRRQKESASRSVGEKLPDININHLARIASC